ncbi:MAG: relaxase domain-containing protein, partial [Actinomycetota bacterium]|nr:relaxase domain-containing protein [Actinomycetota bacterium]
MLSISKLAPGQDRYYSEQAHARVDAAASLATGAEDYYVNQSEARGRWTGSGAGLLGLRGEVDAGQLRRLFAASHPVTGEPIRDTSGVLKVAAFDLTFSAPKSVSILYGLGDDATSAVVRTAHDRAAREALGYLERSAAAVRRGRGGLTILPAEGFVAAAFRHRTSRAGDPQLHTHVVVANLAREADDRWSALDGRRLFEHKMTAGRIYQAVLRGELSRGLGVGWTEPRAGLAEVEGVPSDVIRAFSRRRAEIQGAPEERGTAGARAAEAAALGTRRRKDRSVDPSQLRSEWRARAEGLGWGVEDMERTLTSRAAPELEPGDWEQLSADLAGSDGLTKSRSSFARQDVVRELCDRLPAGAVPTAAHVELLADRFLASNHVVPLIGVEAEQVERSFRRRDGRTIPLAREEQRFSTPELLAVERRLLDVAAEYCHPVGGPRQRRAVRSALAARPTLAAEQAEMVGRLLLGDEGVAVVVGRAGTGKTFALAAAREAWEASGSTVVGAAVARRAASELERRAGIPSTSVQALLGRLEREALPRGAVVVIDEAGMLGTRQLARLAEHVTSAGAKLVLVGDDRQLPELEAGGAFRALARKPHAIHLRENRRQVNEWEREALDHLRFGRVDEALELYDCHGRITVAHREADARDRLVDDWWNGGTDGRLMIASRRIDVEDLNR